MVKFKVTTVREPKAVEYNDWDGHCVVPGFALLRSVEPVPVAELPGAELKQYGHETAFIAVRMPLRDFRRFLGPLRKGDFVDLPDGWLAFQHRWNSDRKQGLCHARVRPGDLASFPPLGGREGRAAGDRTAGSSPAAATWARRSFEAS